MNTTTVSPVKDDDKVVFIRNSSISSDDDSDYDQPAPATRIISKWWFQEPAVKKNCCIILGAWFLLCIGVLCSLTGLVLEIAHFHSDDVIRGLIFIVIGLLVLVPGLYAVIHVYLAAKKIGRIRFSSVWFFR